jgi:microcystin-dependent protein
MATKTFIRTASSSQISSLLTQASASSTYLTKVAASTTYLTQASASIAYIPQVSGMITQYAGTSLPNGWLWCDGGDTQVSTHQNLYNALTSNGTVFPYGPNTNANGVIYFKVPNFTGRVPVGKDDSQTEFDALGETGGTKNVTLTTAQMPIHTHIQDPHKHWISSMSVDDRNLTGTGTNTQDYGTVADAGSYSADDQNSIYGSNTLSQTAVNQNSGSGEAHNNLQPYITVNYIIKT